MNFTCFQLFVGRSSEYCTGAGRFRDTDGTDIIVDVPEKIPSNEVVIEVARKEREEHEMGQSRRGIDVVEERKKWGSGIWVLLLQLLVVFAPSSSVLKDLCSSGTFLPSAAVPPNCLLKTSCNVAVFALHDAWQ